MNEAQSKPRKFHYNLISLFHSIRNNKLINHWEKFDNCKFESSRKHAGMNNHPLDDIR